MIKRANIQWDAKTLTNQIAKNRVSFDNAVQRGQVWKNDRDSLLIHSMIMGYPIPAMYFSKRDGIYDALDGKQRCSSISRFINGEFPLQENFPTVTDDDGNEYDFSEMEFKELEEWAQDAIRTYSLTIYYFEDITDEEIQEMFSRLNNGKPLTAIELTRVKAKSLKLFQQIANHDLIAKSTTDKRRQGYSDEQLVMQVWASLFTDSPSFETKEFRPLIESAEVTQEQIDTISKCFDVILNVYNSYDTTGVDSKKQKRLQKRIVTRTHTVALTKAAYAAMQKNYDMNVFTKFAVHFYSGTKSASINDEYNDSCGGGGLARRDKIETRFSAIIEAMEGFYETIKENEQEYYKQELLNDIAGA